MSTRYHIPLLLLLSAVIFLTNLGGYDLWPPDEPRFAQVAQEMLQTGDYLAPRINGQPYTEKPPMLFWMAAAFSAWGGVVTETTARLPLALGGMITVLLTYLLARDLYGARVALWSGLILATTHRFWWQARFGQIDMLLTTFVIASLYCFWRWHKHRHPAALAGFYLAIAAAVLTKGPPGLLFPLFLAIFFYWKQKSERRALHLPAGIGAVAVIACIWLIPARMAISVEQGAGAGDDIASNMFRQTIGRFFLGISHAQWPWFYATHMPMDLLPWALFLPWSLYWVWKHRRDSEEMRLLLSWVVPAFVFFSASIGKRSVYLLPLYPVLAILLSQSILALVDSGRARWRRNTGLVWAVALLILGLAPAILPFTPFREYWQSSFLIVCGGLAVCGVHALYAALRDEGRGIPAGMAAHTAVLVVLCATVIFPAVNPYKSARFFCAPLRALAERGADFDLYSVGFSREEYVYYAKHFHTPVLCELLPLPGMSELPDYQQARLQSKMQRGIQKAVGPVPVADFSSVTDAELKALEAAVRDNLADLSADDNAYIAEYEEAVAKRLRQLFQSLDGAEPAFMMAQEEDWRWILALCPEGVKYHVLKDTNVGSRNVMLLANDAGASATAEEGGSVFGAGEDRPPVAAPSAP